MKERYLIKIEYSGLNYSGWQSQKNTISVQDVIENSLFKLFNEKISLFASSRTDAKVSALAQTAHFDVSSNIETKSIPFALNALLPYDISVKKCVLVPKNFHARFWDKIKTYRYKIYSSKTRSPVLDRSAFHEKRNLDLAIMKSAGEAMIGFFDCTCFLKQGGSLNELNKHIYKVDVSLDDDNVYNILISANGFLYKMARTMSAALLLAGAGKLSVEEIHKAILNKDKSKFQKTLVANYLCLVDTEYINPPFDKEEF